MGETIEELQAELRRQKVLAEQKREMERIHAERMKLKAEIQALKQQNSKYTTTAWDAIKGAGQKAYSGLEKMAVAQREREKSQKTTAKQAPKKQKPSKKNDHLPGFQETWSLFD